MTERADSSALSGAFSKKGLWAFLFLGILFFFYVTRDILLPFAVGAFFAFILNPMTTSLSKKIGRSGATLLSLAFLFSFFAFAFLGAVPLIKSEIFELSQRLPSYVDRLSLWIQPWMEILKGHLEAEQFGPLDQSVQKNFSSLFSWGLRFLGQFFSRTLALANLLSLFIITPIVAFYLLRDWPLILKSLDPLLPRKTAPMIRELLSKINDVLGGYARGQVMVCLILAVYYALTLSLLGLPYGVTIGLFTGFLAFIPYFGFLVGVLAAFGMALSHFEGWVFFALVGSVFFVGQIIESYILLPRLIGDRVGLHPLWILFALLAGGVLMGFFGLLIAMPLAAALGVIVRFAVSVYKKDNVPPPDELNSDDG